MLNASEEFNEINLDQILQKICILKMPFRVTWDNYDNGVTSHILIWT